MASDAANQAALLKAIRVGRAADVACLLDGGGVALNPSDCTEDALPLALAVVNGHTEIAKLLIERGANVNTPTVGIYARYTPLHFAVLGRHQPLVGLLLRAGAAVDAQTKDGDTALHWAAATSNHEAIKLLLDAGADRTLRNARERTAEARAPDVPTKELVHVIEPPKPAAAATPAKASTPARRTLADVPPLATSAVTRTPAPAVASNTAQIASPIAAAPGSSGKLNGSGTRAGGSSSLNGSGTRGSLNGSLSKGTPRLPGQRITLDDTALDMTRTPVSREALLEALKDGNVKELRTALDSGKEINPAMVALAARYGHVPVLQLLVERGADVNAPAASRGERSVGETPLITAAMKNRIPAMQFLVDNGAEINLQMEDGDTVLHKVAAGGPGEALEWLMVHGADKTILNNKGETAESVADPTAATFIRRYGRVIPPNKALEESKSSLSQSRSAGKGVKGRRKKKKGSSSRSRSRTPTGKGKGKGKAKGGRASPTRVSDLKKKEPAGRGSPGTMALESTAMEMTRNDDSREKLLEALKEGDVDTLRHLIDDGGKKVNAAMVVLAARYGHVEVLKLLMRRGGDVNEATAARTSGKAAGGTPLMSASAKGHIPAMLVLLENHADINAQTDDGETALHRAAAAGQEEAVVWLLNNGADRDLLNEEDKTAEDVAANEELAAVVRRHGRHRHRRRRTPTSSPNLEASKSGTHMREVQASKENERLRKEAEAMPHKERSEPGRGSPSRARDLKAEGGSSVGRGSPGTALLEATAMDMTQNDANRELLLEALKEGDVDTIREIIDGGKPVNRAMFALAARYGHVEVIKLMLRRGAEVNGATPPREGKKGGETPLMTAAAKNRLPTLQVLVDNGADINQQNEEGDTALHKAATALQAEAVRWLLDHGANKSLKNSSGLIAEAIARKAKGGDDIADAIHSHGRAPLEETNNSNSDLERLPARGAANSKPLASSSSGMQNGMHSPAGQSSVNGSRPGSVQQELQRYSNGTPQVVPHAATPYYEGVQPLALSRTPTLGSHTVSPAPGKPTSAGTTLAPPPTQNGVVPRPSPSPAVLSASHSPVNGRSPNSTLNGSSGKPAHIARVSLPADPRRGSPALAVNQAALLQAIRVRSHADVHWLLQQAESTFDLNPVDSDEDTHPLAVACSNGDLAIVQELVKGGENRRGKFAANVNVATTSGTFVGFTPLHFATLMRHLHVMEFLLKHGAKINAQDENGFTPLHGVAATGFNQAIPMLLNFDASRTVRTHRGETPEDLARNLRHPDTADAIRDFKASRGAPGQRDLLAAIRRGRVDLVRRLLDVGPQPVVDINPAASTDVTNPIVFAAACGQLEIVALLLERGARASAVVTHGEAEGGTPLMLATASNRIAVMQLLLDHGAHINAQDATGQTALHIAAMLGLEDAIRVLLGHSANRSLLTTDGYSAEHMARENGYTLEADMIRDHGVAPREAARLSRNGNRGHNNNGGSPTEAMRRSEDAVGEFHNAVAVGNVAALRRLLNESPACRGALSPPHFHEQNHPLFRAAKNGHSDIVQLFLDAGVSANVATTHQLGAYYPVGTTPLMMTIEEGRLAVMRVLLAAGANINARDVDGSTVLHRAVLGGPAVLRLLLERGADKTIQNKLGDTAETVARKSNCNVEAELIRAYVPVRAFTENAFSRPAARTPPPADDEHMAAQEALRRKQAQWLAMLQ